MIIFSIVDILALILGLIYLIWVCSLKYKECKKQFMCPHHEVHETMACEAICDECGKNLGFIGTWRNTHQK